MYSGSTITVHPGATLLFDLTALSGSTFKLEDDSAVQFDGPAEFRDSSIFDIGAVTTITVNDTVDIGEGGMDVDWDGSGEDSHTIVNEDGILSLNVNQLDSGGGNDTFDGTLEINSGRVNVDVADGNWRIRGQLNMDNTVGVAPVLYSPDTLAIAGGLHVGGAGPSRIHVPESSTTVTFAFSSMAIVDRDLQLDNRLTVVARRGTFMGAGRLVNLPGRTLDLLNGADTGNLPVVNEGVLQIAGAGAVGQVMVGGFDQTTTGEFHVDLTSPVSGNYDQLNVMGHASLAGELNAATGGGYLDPTVPGTVDAFVLIVADSLSGTFDDVIYDGNPLTAPTTHVGSGLFRIVDYDFSSGSADMRC